MKTTNLYENLVCSIPKRVKKILMELDPLLRTELINRAIFLYLTKKQYKELIDKFPSKEDYDDFDQKIYELYEDLFADKKTRKLKPGKKPPARHIEENLESSIKKDSTEEKDRNFKENQKEQNIIDFNEDFLNEFDY